MGSLVEILGGSSGVVWCCGAQPLWVAPVLSIAGVQCQQCHSGNLLWPHHTSRQSLGSNTSRDSPPGRETEAGSWEVSQPPVLVSLLYCLIAPDLGGRGRGQVGTVMDHSPQYRRNSRTGQTVSTTVPQCPASHHTNVARPLSPYHQHCIGCQ